MKKILWVGDAPDCQSGFGKVTREICARLDYRLGGKYDVTVLGINHRGDPVTVPYGVYCAAAGGDSIGVGRLKWMCHIAKPDLIVLQNDGWNMPRYVEILRERLANGEYKHPDYARIPIVAGVAIDGLNFQGDWLEGIDRAVFWTMFALEEARLGGYAGPADVIPLGVDADAFYPVDKKTARRLRGLPENLADAFIVGNVNRNQPRKRWDLTVKYFAEWVKRSGPHNAYLYLHSAPTGDTSVDVESLIKYWAKRYDIDIHTILVEPPTFYGLTEQNMMLTYNCFDVCISTSQGEGFGLPALEAMACGVPCILPDWAAYGDWAKGAAHLVKCSSTVVGLPFVNVIGGVADEDAFVEALDRMYADPTTRAGVRSACFARANEPRFRWDDVAGRWAATLEDVLRPKTAVASTPRVAETFDIPQRGHKPTEAEWADLGRPEDVTA